MSRTLSPQNSLPEGADCRAVGVVTENTSPPTLPISLSLRAAFQPDEDGCIHAYLPSLPGVITSARTKEDARAMLADALREYLLSLDAESAGAPSSERLVLTIT